MNKHKDKKIVYVNTYNEESIMFKWGIEKVGFGEISFYYKNGELKCGNECMSKEFIKAILCDFVDRLTYSPLLK